MGSNAGFRTQELTARRFREAVAHSVQTQHGLLGDVAGRVAHHDRLIHALDASFIALRERGFWGRLNWLVTGR